MSIFSSSALSFTLGALSLLGKCCDSQQSAVPRAQCAEEALENLATFRSFFKWKYKCTIHLSTLLALATILIQIIPSPDPTGNR